MTALQMSRAAHHAVIDHARAEAPRECCGLLVGEGTVVERAVATRNESESPLTRYRVHPADHFALIRELRDTRRRIMGAYHSHPSSAAAPSATDLAEAWPDPFVYVIVSLEDKARPDVRAYAVMDGAPSPVTLRMVD